MYILPAKIIFNGTSGYTDPRFRVYEDNRNPKHLAYFVIKRVTSFNAGYYRLYTTRLVALSKPSTVNVSANLTSATHAAAGSVEVGSASNIYTNLTSAAGSASNIYTNLTSAAGNIYTNLTSTAGAEQQIIYGLGVTVVTRIALVKKNETRENIIYRASLVYKGEYNPRAYIEYSYENITNNISGSIPSGIPNDIGSCISSYMLGSITNVGGNITNVVPTVTETLFEMSELPVVILIKINKNNFKGRFTIRFTYYKSLRGRYYGEPNMMKAKVVSFNVT